MLLRLAPPALGGVERREPVRGGAHDAIGGGKLDVVGGVIPKAGGFDQLTGLAVFDAPKPLAGFKHENI